MTPIRILAFAILLLMLGVILWASMQQAIWSIPPDVIRNRWFVATLADAYAGFLIFFAWICSREDNWNTRIGWFLALSLLGNVASAIYLIKEFTPRRRRRRVRSNRAT